MSILHINGKQEEEIILDIAKVVIHARKKYRSEPLAHIFDKAWEYVFKRYITNDHWTKNGLPHIENWFYINFQLDLKEYFLLTLVIIFRKLGAKDFSPRIFAKKNPAFTSLLQDSKSAIVVTTHNGFSFPGYLLGENGKNVTTISSHPDVKQIFKRTGVKKEISVVSNDIYSLVRLQEKIKSGDSIVVAIDYSSEDGKYIYINDGLFKFANINSLRSFFATSEVLDDGSVHVDFMEASDMTTPAEKVNELINFINERRSFKKELYLKPLRVK